MALTANQRRKAANALMRVWSARGVEIGCLKQDIYDALIAVDAWVEANQANYNLAIPVAARTALGATEKVEMLYAVATMRTGRKVEQED
jgi:hypothetical protein